ncbi:MAG: hypothetical protein IKV29_06920, partial [Alistipes sp.]|nr:hypothetical protein [Alistipes sp.]
LAALVLGMVSCQTDVVEGLHVDANGEAELTLQVGLPEATRAAGEDSALGAIGNINMSEYDIRYILEVYDENGVLAKDRITKTSDDTSMTFSLRLVPGRAYNFVVWADFVPEGTEADYHYNTSAGLRAVKVITDQWTVIDESRDAYTDVATVHNFSNTSVIPTITLTRPFAKLRVVTNDILEMISIRPAEVTVNYFNTTFYDTFDAFAEKASGSYTGHALKATLLDAQKNPTDVYSNENPEVTGVQTLFADYFFGAEDDRVMFTMDVKDNGGRDLPKVTFNTNIPVNRNHLTTIYGPVLTDSNNITVEIKDAFENEKVVYNVETTEELAAAVAAAKNGDTILIDGEVTMPYFTGKELNFVGVSTRAGVSSNAVVKQSPATHIDAFYAGATLNFENLTLVGESYQNNTQGYQKAAKETYTNCHFVNYIMFAGEETIVTDCTFENEGQYFWTGTAKDITFTNCVFNGVERAVKVCTVGNAGDRTVTLNNCEFTATTQVKSAIEIDGSKGSSYVVNINGCSATGFKVSDYTGESLFNIEGADHVKVYIDGNEWLEKGVVKDDNGNYVVNSLTTLETALEAAGAAGAGNTTIVFAENATLDMTGTEWTPINVDGYHGADVVTIDGKGATIKGLTSALFAGGFAGGSGIVIKNLTIEDSQIIANNTQGYGAFVNCADSMAVITLENCHLKNSSIITPNDGAAESRIGGLVGWTSGYNNQNDGPVDTFVTIKNCSVIGCALKGFGSIGAICGHAGANAATYTTIENCTVKDNTLASTDDGGWRVGVVVGTANVGELTISNITESGNTLTQTGKTAPVGFMRNLYGRAVLGTTGKLTIDGYKYVSEGQFEDATGNKVVASADALSAALADNTQSEINLAAGNYEGTFHVLRNVKIVGADNAKIIGRVHINSANATFENVMFDRNETNSNEPNNTVSNALNYKAVVMIYGDQTHTIKFDGCEFYNNNGTNKSAITNVACDLIIDNCYFEGYSSSIYSQANLSVTNSTFNYTTGQNVILSINGCKDNGGKVIFKNNTITNKIFALAQFLNTVDFGNGTYHFDVQGNTGAGFDYYFLNEGRVANKTFAEGSVTF